VARPDLQLKVCRHVASTPSPVFANEQVPGDKKVAPLTRGGVSHPFKQAPLVDISLMVEVIVH
jgi:hypothetical protein